MSPIHTLIGAPTAATAYLNKNADQVVRGGSTFIAVPLQRRQQQRRRRRRLHRVTCIPVKVHVKIPAIAFLRLEHPDTVMEVQEDVMMVILHPNRVQPGAHGNTLRVVQTHLTALFLATANHRVKLTRDAFSRLEHPDTVLEMQEDVMIVILQTLRVNQ